MFLAFENPLAPGGPLVVDFRGESVSSQLTGARRIFLRAVIVCGSFPRATFKRGKTSSIWFRDRVHAFATVTALPDSTPSSDASANPTACTPNAAPNRRASRGPVVLWGFTGREESSQAYVFAQEDNFYYLTGHNEEGAGLIILPAPKAGANGTVNGAEGLNGVREIFSCRPRIPPKKNGTAYACRRAIRASKRSPDSPRSSHSQKCAPQLRSWPKPIRFSGPFFLTKKNWADTRTKKPWSTGCSSSPPQDKLKDARQDISALRQIKSPAKSHFSPPPSSFRWIRIWRRHENDAARSVRISGRRENGRSARHGRLRSGRLRADCRRRTKFRCAALRQALAQNRRRRYRGA